MKRIKKVLFAIIALFAFWAINVNAAPNDSILIIKKEVNVGVGASVPKETYNFELSAMTVTPNTTEQGGKIDVYTGIMTGLQPTYSIPINTGNTGQVNIDFSAVNFTKPGIYRYLIKETAGTLAGMTYDNSEHELDIYVGSNDNGQTYVVERIIAYKRENGIRDTKSGVTGVDGTEIKFTNVFATQSFVVRNLLTGSQADYTKQFTYNVTINENATTLPNGTVITAKKTLQNGTMEDVTITVGTASTFTLAHNETLNIPNIPENVQYTVVQNAEVSYDTTIKVYLMQLQLPV